MKEDVMTLIASKMLMGDKSKYFAIVFGVTFACFLIAEQSAIFCGVMLRTTSQIYDTQRADNLGDEHRRSLRR
jgi:putative ABC transport system permease protein